MGNLGLIGSGIVLIFIAGFGYVIPISEVMDGVSIAITIPESVGFCSSTAGQLSQAYYGEAVKTCSEYNIMLYGIYASGLVGIILLVVGVVISESKSKEKSLTCKYCNFVALSEPELLKHNSENHLDKSPYKCEHCDFIGITEEILWNHYNDEHPDKKKWKWN